MFIIYGTSWCPWCDKAKELIEGNYIFKNIEDLEHLQEYRERFPGKKTVPQIVVITDDSVHNYTDEYVGGYEDLVRYLHFK